MGEVLNLDVVEFYTAEANEAHRLMDRVGVPAVLQDERLSLSQRVAVLAAGYASAVLTNRTIEKAKQA